MSVFYDSYMVKTKFDCKNPYTLSARSEVLKLPERYKLSVKLDVVGIPGHEEWGTLDTLR